MLAVLARRTGGARFPLSSLNLVVHKAHLSEAAAREERAAEVEPDLAPVIEEVAAANKAAVVARRAFQRSSTIAPTNLPFDDPKVAFKSKSNLDLMRSLAVFQMCRLRPIVDNADSILAWSKRIFGSTLVNAVVRQTFYKHFVAGKDKEEMQPTLQYLAKHGIAAILDYAAEDDLEASEQDDLAGEKVVARVYNYEGEDLCDRRMEVFLKAIDAASTMNGHGFVAIKLTALGLPELLERVSNALTAIRGLFQQFDDDGNGSVSIEEFKRVYKEFFIDDADDVPKGWFEQLDVTKDGQVDYIDWTGQHSWFQPAVDHATAQLQAEHNRERPIVFGTYQCYLKDALPRLAFDLERARRGGYRFGAKLVRGAYMVVERRRAAELGVPSPIHDSLAATHESYDACVAEVMAHVADEGAGMMVATHNQASIEAAVAAMEERGLGPQAGVYFGQLLGMADNLTFVLGQHGYGAYKYVPFGSVDEAMPYLIRRAQENSDMLGGVGKEMAMMRRELRRRLLG
ncbi:Proline dehydrogenase 1, mitochondrial [Auxenochlorella protothecoides]|uniref:Proline dehydrogenase n=1 Tax=Auxenochlorella protothecoides TaxID=3075 RepID=A0A087SM96_AUXPR|nr:Proline dehydrogenase 1, mitochondrial [Auxenochlorella protothecoides]KFM26850.1 Proline dehydrogenase 1, mitochondrial [Auxenochlorella protothecoides]